MRERKGEREEKEEEEERKERKEGGTFMENLPIF